MAVYDQLLGQSPPHQNDEWWEQFATTMWKGEFLGILSEFFNPDGGTDRFNMYPAIYNHATAMYGLLRGSPAPLIGKKQRDWLGFDQTIDQMLKSTFSIYNQSRKIYTQTTNKYNKGHLEYSKLYREFEKKLKPKESKEHVAISSTTKTPFFIDLKNAFNLGSEKQFAKQYVITFYAIANDYHREGLDEFGFSVRNLNDAFKAAESTMKRTMKGLNPNKGSYDTKSKVGRVRHALFQEQYLTKEQKLELEKLETQYKYKMRKFEKNLPKYLKEFNISELGGRFDWK